MDSLLWRVLNQVRARRFNEDGLKFMAHVLTRMVPEDIPHPEPLYHLANDGRSLSTDEQKEEWKKFLTELAQVEQMLARFFGQAQLWELSRQRVGNLANADKAVLHALVRDADTILREFDGRRPKDDDGVDVLRGVTESHSEVSRRDAPQQFTTRPAHPSLVGKASLSTASMDGVIGPGSGKSRCAIVRKHAPLRRRLGCLLDEEVALLHEPPR